MFVIVQRIMFRISGHKYLPRSQCPWSIGDLITMGEVGWQVLTNQALTIFW